MISLVATPSNALEVIGQKITLVKSYSEKYRNEVHQHTQLISTREIESIKSLKNEIETQRPNKFELSYLSKSLKINFLPPKISPEDIVDFYENLNDHLMNYHPDIGKSAIDNLVRKQPYCPMPHDLIGACEEELESIRTTFSALEYKITKHENERIRREQPLQEQNISKMSEAERKIIEDGFTSLVQELAGNLKRVPQ